MKTTPATRPQLRVYPLDPQRLTQEQIAVTFAMTSRNAAPFDEIQKAVTEAKAADFHERWVLNYGHASVAEHAVIHMAVENLSRLACDELEDNRLGSYTEKSSRYQVLDRGSYHVPAELRGHTLERDYVRTCDHLFDVYHQLVERTLAHQKATVPRRAGEKDGAYNLRLRREATDHCRFILPASTLTNTGVTMNARSLEHAITKLLSSGLAESVDLGERLKAQGRAITPTLIKYADRNAYVIDTRQARAAGVGDPSVRANEPRTRLGESAQAFPARVSATLVHWDPEAQEKLTASLLYPFSHEPYDALFKRTSAMTAEGRERVIDEALKRLSAFDMPPRELETVDYTFDLLMDYGAYREYRRHRMQTTVPQPLTVVNGYVMPPLVEAAGVGRQFHEAMETVHSAYRSLSEVSPTVAQYVVTHAHLRRVIAKMNLRECYHLFKLRGSPQAHFTIRDVVLQARDRVREVHPLLLKYIRMRE